MVEECSDYSDEEFFVGAITKENEDVKEWTIESKVNGTSTILKLDTGAQCNVMPNSLFSMLTNAKITKSKTKLLSYSGHSIRVIGKSTLLIGHKGKYFPVEFQVVSSETDALPIIGLPTCLEMNLIKRIYTVNTHTSATGAEEQTNADKIMEEFRDVFKGLGCLDGEYHIKTDPNVLPVVHPPCKVPFALKGKLKEELERMENLGVITKVTDPT